MPPVTTPDLVRVACRRRLIEQIRAQVTDPDIGVFYRLPAHYGGRLVIAAVGTQGRVSVRAFGRNPVPLEDRFSIEVACAAAPGSVELDLDDPIDPGGYEALDSAVEGLVSIVVATVAADPRLDLGGTVTATVAEVVGPTPQTFGQDGIGSAAQVTVEFVTQLPSGAIP